MVSLGDDVFRADRLFSMHTCASFLFTNGDGNITPYQSGQMLQVGQTYNITATPDVGYQFSSWQPVQVFIFTQTNFNGSGNPILPPVQSIVPSIIPTNIYGAELTFTMQDTISVTSAGENPNIVEAFGWQANFLPVPEPANITSIAVHGQALTIAANNGVPTGIFTLVESTNLLLPAGLWTPVLTNNFDGGGNLNLTTNVINPSNAEEFYLIEQP